ncbi:MAG TPA: putative colanic acid biosynthesis acetyltransferase [Opitutales bacterium]|nr:putative colanic acid biosynthesis acetyltransferase [Opitutales bacterium]
MALDIQSNRKAAKYSRKELCLRVLWGFGKLAFKFSPRPCFGFRRWLLRCFGAKVGNRTNIYPSALIYYPWNLEIGEDSAIGEWALVYNLGLVRIGSRTTISQRVHLCAGTHDYTDPAMPLIKPPIVIDDEVWICADVFVGPDVTVEGRAIVAAASVVVKDVETGAIVGGNPAKFIKDRKLAE